MSKSAWNGNDTSPPPFEYSNVIKTPTELNSGTSAKKIGPNMDALMAYIKLIITSDSKANPFNPNPLGNKFFLKTTATCTDENGDQVPRYIYVQNTPDARYDLLSIREDKPNGLLTGIVTNLVKTNPATLFMALAESGNPKCTKVTAQVTPEFDAAAWEKDPSLANKLIWETRNMSERDAFFMDPCQLPNGVNNNSWDGEVPKGGDAKCSQEGGIQQLLKDRVSEMSEGFQNKSSNCDDSINKLYYTLISIVGLYILFCFIKKNIKL